jgi:hypothetical protein
MPLLPTFLSLFFAVCCFFLIFFFHSLFLLTSPTYLFILFRFSFCSFFVLSRAVSTFLC